MSGAWTDEQVPCGDPECAVAGGMADPERDGDVTFYACTTCGYEFGYQRAGAVSDGACALGIPESVRRQASRAPAGAQPVFVQIGRRPDA